MLKYSVKLDEKKLYPKKSLC